MSKPSLKTVLTEARACTHCAEHLPHPPRPVLRLTARTRVLIIGQAPGTKVHASGVDWDDASGARLRDWLGVTSEVFYGPLIGVMPMGFCYPGRGKSGDLPPRPECAPLWHPRLLPCVNEVRVTLLVGAYAQRRVLGEGCQNVTETVRGFRTCDARYFPLPHPSPRNLLWQRKNPWFDGECLPALRQRVAEALT